MFCINCLCLQAGLIKWCRGPINGPLAALRHSWSATSSFEKNLLWHRKHRRKAAKNVSIIAWLWGGRELECCFAWLLNKNLEWPTFIPAPIHPELASSSYMHTRANCLDGYLKCEFDYPDIWYTESYISIFFFCFSKPDTSWNGTEKRKNEASYPMRLCV